MMVFFWYCAIAPLTDKADAVLNGSSTPIVANFDMVRMKCVKYIYIGNPQYKWNLICLAPGLLLYMLRWGWRKYYENSYGILNKPIPGSGTYQDDNKRASQTIIC